MTLDEAKESLGAYVRKEHPVGHFLTACLAHDLFEAVGRADESSMVHLRGIVQYIYCRVPGDCHGSYERIKEWLTTNTRDTSKWKDGDSG
jgi:hypothetical protein